MLAITIPLLILGGVFYNLFILVVALMATKEFLDIRETKKKFPLFIKIVTYLLVAGICTLNMTTLNFNYTIRYDIICGFFLVYLLPLVFINNHDKYNITDAFFAMSIVFFLGSSLGLLILIRNIDIMFIIYLFLITTITDTFAYLTGMLIGKTKLCEKISPKKTVEGLIGGVFVGSIIPSIFFLNMIDPTINIFIICGCTFLMALIGQCGDLVFSSIKRYYGKKDFSNLIPGHGGILDRLDSIIFVLLTYIIIMNFL